MQCPQCQCENRAGRRFCAECGAPLPLACPACGFTNEPGEKFCGGCGTPLAGVPGILVLRLPGDVESVRTLPSVGGNASAVEGRS